jgi:hypothetical protein
MVLIAVASVLRGRLGGGQNACLAHNALKVKACQFSSPTPNPGMASAKPFPAEKKDRV